MQAASHLLLGVGWNSWTPVINSSLWILDDFPGALSIVGIDS
jgi:hypothetical protein